VLLKRYVFPVAAAVSVALGAAGGALAGAKPAKPHPAPAHAHAPSHVLPATSLVPRFAPQPGDWLKTLQKFPRDPKPASRRPVRVRPVERRRATTLSIYEQTTKPWILGAQGCSAARRHETGIVVLDFGKPAFKHHGYGTTLFSGRYEPIAVGVPSRWRAR
jgi:hypothetical protein